MSGYVELITKLHFEIAELKEELRQAENPYTEEGLCPTCHCPDGMRAHNMPCYYCGAPINSLAGNPSLWSLQFPQPDGTGICRNYHVGCIIDRLRRYDLMLKVSHIPDSYKQEVCEHIFVPSNPKSQIEYQSSGVKCALCSYYPHEHWYCPDSPNHLCTYTEDYDSCDFCGQPEERK